MMIDPIAQFITWFEEAKANASIAEPTAMTLATATKDGSPSARMVLLKGIDARGFVFYTNMDSRKSEEIKANPRAALCFFWKALGRQVRVEGEVQRVSEAEADAYFATRPVEARIGAIASEQSRPMLTHDALAKKMSALKAQYGESNPPPRPADWSGWRVVPERIEFWHEGQFRLHDRDLYTREGANWSVQKLYP